MVQLTNPLIIFGRSPFINKIADFIPKLQSKYINIGINTFPQYYPDVDYWFFIDRDAAHYVNVYYQGQKCVTGNICRDLCVDYKFNADIYTLINDFPYPAQNKKYLGNYYFTHSIALNWAYQNGFKDVILAGIDLDGTIEHFDYFCDFKPDQNLVIKARKQIEEIYKPYLNIYQLNPDSDMNIPKIRIEDLL